MTAFGMEFFSFLYGGCASRFQQEASVFGGCGLYHISYHDVEMGTHCRKAYIPSIFCCLNGGSNETKEIFNTINDRSLWLLIWQRRLLQLYEIAVYPTCQKRFVYQRG